MRLDHRFVEHIPDELDDRVLYVSIPFGTVVHKCACGCGQEVVTPLGPAEWRLTYDGRTVSLAPSIGNWSFDCRSHYWIEAGNVRWARRFSGDEVARVRRKARARRESFYTEGVADRLGIVVDEESSGETQEEHGVWRLTWERIRGRRRRLKRRQ